MDIVRQIKDEYAKYINENYEEMKSAAEDMREDLEHTPLYYKGRLTSRPLAIPRVYSKEMIDQFKEIVDITYGIFVKMIDEYLNCADYRALFPFSKELEELILAPRGYEAHIPVARFDIFYNEDTRDFHFCEINCDGTTGMDEDRIQDRMMIHNPAHQEMLRKYDLKTFELFDSYVEEFLGMYSSYEHKVERPNVVVVDFLEKGIYREFEEFVRRFQKAGVYSEICDIRDLRYENGKLLTPKGHVVDAIYRRAVTMDIMEHYDEVQPFVQAVKEGSVFVAGALCTQIVHNKWIFHMMHHPRSNQFLTNKEQEFIKAHVPNTVPFNSEWIDKETVKQHKNEYVVKPPDGYAAKGVMAGLEFSQEEWEEKMDEVYGGDYLCQDYAPQYEFDNIDFICDDGTWKKYISMAGLYVWNGKFAGVFARSGLKDGIIDYTNNERRQVTYYLEK